MGCPSAQSFNLCTIAHATRAHPTLAAVGCRTVTRSATGRPGANDSNPLGARHATSPGKRYMQFDYDDYIVAQRKTPSEEDSGRKTAEGNLQRKTPPDVEIRRVAQLHVQCAMACGTRRTPVRASLWGIRLGVFVENTHSFIKNAKCVKPLLLTRRSASLRILRACSGFDCLNAHSVPTADMTHHARHSLWPLRFSTIPETWERFRDTNAMPPQPPNGRQRRGKDIHL